MRPRPSRQHSADCPAARLNTVMRARASLARVRFADPFPVFNPQEDPAAELQAQCTLTRLCSEGDSHPSDAGYRALANLVFDASDYQRFPAVAR